MMRRLVVRLFRAVSPTVVAVACIQPALTVAHEHVVGFSRAERQHRRDGIRETGSDYEVAHSFSPWFMQNLLLVCQPITAKIDYFQTFHRSTIDVVKIADLSVARFSVEKLSPSPRWRWLQIALCH
jgi:hypothetical protein